MSNCIRTSCTHWDCKYPENCILHLMSDFVECSNKITKEIKYDIKIETKNDSSNKTFS